MPPSVVGVSLLDGPRLHVPTRRRLDRLVPRTAQLAPRGNGLAGLRLQPFGPMGPPAAGHFARAGQPGIAIVRERTIDPMAALVLRGRIDVSGDVSAGAEHELRLSAQQLHAPVRGAP